MSPCAHFTATAEGERGPFFNLRRTILGVRHAPGQVRQLSYARRAAVFYYSQARRYSGIVGREGICGNIY